MNYINNINNNSDCLSILNNIPLKLIHTNDNNNKILGTYGKILFLRYHFNAEINHDFKCVDAQFQCYIKHLQNNNKW